MSADHLPHDPTAAASHEDANLRALASATGLPGADSPDAAQLARWKAGDDQSAGAGPIPIAAGRRSGRLRRRLLAAGSAVAATAAVAAVLFTQGRSSKVEAATILRSLQQAVIRGVNVSLQGEVGDDIAVNGEIRVRFAAPLDLDRLMADPPVEVAEPDISALYGAIDVVIGDDGPLPGLNARLEFASTQPSTWVFVRSNNPNVVAPDANARRVMGFIAQGVMLDLGDGGLDVFDKLDLGGDMEGTISIQADRGGLKVQVDEDADGAGAANQPAATPEDMLQHDRLVRSIISGRAGEQELQELLELLERHAADATVEPQGNGRYLLKVLLDPDQLPADPAANAGSMVQVAYTQDLGVEWAEFHTVGDITGSMRIEFAADAIDPALVDKNRVIVPGRTMIMTPEIIRGFIDAHQ